MRPTVLIVPILIACGTLQAQPPIIYAVDHLPMAGTSRNLLYKALVDDPLPGGADVVWDYLFLTDPAPAPVDYVVPDNPYFSEATLAIVIQGSSGQARFLSLTDEGLVEHGTYTPPTPTECTMVFTDRKILLPPQITYGEDAIDEYAGACNENILTEEGILESTADGYGTLILPLNTWTDVLRIASVREFTFGGVPFREETLDYYVSQVPEALLNTTRLFVSLGGNEQQVSYAANYIDEVGLGMKPEDRDGMRVFPNPASDVVRVNCPGIIKGMAGLEFLDATGRLVYREPIWNALAGSELSVSIDDLATGCYTLLLRDADGIRATSRFVKE